MKTEFTKVQKETRWVKEDIPRYQDGADILTKKISHKRTKSIESIKEITLTKTLIAKCESDL